MPVNFNNDEAKKAIKLSKTGNKYPLNLATTNKWIGVDLDGFPKEYLEKEGFFEGVHYVFRPIAVGEADVSSNYYLTVNCFQLYCQGNGDNGKTVRSLYEQLERENISTSQEFLQLIQDERMSNGNLSIRGVARCCDVKISVIGIPITLLNSSI